MSSRERIEAMVETVLNPLLQKDGGAAEVVALEDDVLTLRLRGSLVGCPGTPYVKRAVIEPVIRKAAGAEVQIVYEGPNF